MDITALLIIIIYFAIIIVPLAVVIRESLREIGRLEAEVSLTQERKRQKRDGTVESAGTARQRR